MVRRVRKGAKFSFCCRKSVGVLSRLLSVAKAIAASAKAAVHKTVFGTAMKPEVVSGKQLWVTRQACCD